MFGPMAVTVDGSPLPPLRSRKGLHLLALLALRANREVSRDWIAGTLWPENDESQALAYLRQNLSELRRALGESGSCLRTPAGNTLALSLEGVKLDVATFDDAVTRGDEASLEAAVDLYLGPLLEGWAEEWILQERECREQAILGALESLAAQRMERGEPVPAAGFLRRIVATDPLRETSQRSLMQALAASGEYAAATETYRNLRLLMHRELNSEPSPETTALFQQIREEARQRAATGGRVIPSSGVAQPAHPGDVAGTTFGSEDGEARMAIGGQALSGTAGNDRFGHRFDRENPQRLVRTRLATATVIGASLLSWAGWSLYHRAPSGLSVSNASAAGGFNSVAVLPFVNMSADKADEYLSDGMSEEIITALSKIRGLKVPARTSCFVFKGRNEDIGSIGRQLHVDAVLEGSVCRAGNKLRVTAQLITIADGNHIWAEKFDRPLDNLLEIRSDVATQVADSLKGHLLGEEKRQLAKHGTENPEANRLYLKGRYQWSRRTKESVNKAAQYFNLAIAEDPDYALAYAGLADCYSLSPRFGVPISDCYPKARAAAAKALELDSSLAAPHANLADAKWDFPDWDVAGAEAEYCRAIDLDPNCAPAHGWYSTLLIAMGRQEEALAENNRALELDPLSPIVNAGHARFLAWLGRSNEAVALLRRQIAMDPSFAVAHENLGIAYECQGLYREAVDQLETAYRLDTGRPSILALLGYGYGRAGRKEDARRILGKLIDLQNHGTDARIAIASVQHGLGEDAQALDTLDKAYDEHASFLGWIHLGPVFADLRGHPRFQAILRRIHLVK